MMLGFIPKNPNSFPRQIHHFLSSNFKFKFKSLVSSCNNNNHSQKQSENSFLPWLQAKSHCEISSLLTIGNSIYGRSLFASQFIQTGDCILKIPFSVHLTPDYLPRDIDSLLSDDVGHVARLAIVILIEQRKGKDSEWEPYISCLPLRGMLHSSIFWSNEELEMIRQSMVYQETNDRKIELEKEYFALRPALDQFPKIFQGVTFEDFLHAFSLVASRAWGSSKAVSLVPFADFLNHDGVTEAILVNDEEKQISEVIADQDYAPGTQVLVRYGKFPNSTLLLDFGFTLSYNVYDQVQIQMDVSHHDPLRTMKMELLHKYPSPKSKTSNNSDSLWNIFSLKEVRHGDSRGKGIPQSLRAFSRLLCANTIEELEDLELEAVQTDGRLARLPLKNTRKEIESHQLLLSRIAMLIQDYDTFITSLESLRDKKDGGNIVIRTRMAHDLLSGELRVLRSASAWLNNYSNTLNEDKSTSTKIL